ncbi:MAG: (2Fe-2S) ferredoxin domain-containing protein [Candidatus Dormibacteria bacterium]
MTEAAASRNLHVFVCTTVGRHHCGGMGSEKVLLRLRDELERRHLTHVRTTRMGCNQQHHQGPILIVYPDGVWYGHLTPADVDEIVEEHLVNDRVVERLRIVPDGEWSSTALT